MKLFNNLSESKKPQQKTVMFYNRELVNGLVEEEAAVKSTTSSAIIESAILNQLMPKNENLQVLLYPAYTKEIPIKIVFVNLFSRLAINGGDAWRIRNNRKLLSLLADIVEFKTPQFKNNPLFQGNYSASYLKRNVETVIEAEEANEEMLTFIHKSAFEISIKNGSDLFSVLIMILDEAWNEAFSLTATYKVMMEMAKLAPEDAFKKSHLYRLRNLLLELEKEWE